MFDSALSLLQLPPPGSTVVVAMSGGVDSSLVAVLLAEHGCRVIGATMRVYDGSIQFPEGTGSGCYGPGEEEDEETCRRLCLQLGVDYRVVDLSGVYAREILGNFKSEYRSGRTPNPCLRCNPLLKFGLLPQALRDGGLAFDYYATGHYVRLFAPEARGALPYLAPATDPKKDQSYFLYRVRSEVLASVRFPLGSMSKTEVRRLALDRGLESAEKKDSQDFIAADDYGLVFADDPPASGDIVDSVGKKLGTHHGIVRYTIGQRRGIGLSAGSDPLYVVGLNAQANSVVVGPESALLAAVLEADDPVWAPGFGTTPFRAFVKIRLASKPAPALVTPQADGSVNVDFDEPQRAIAPGQSVVFYVDAPEVGLVIAGGAVIKSRERNARTR